MRYKGEVRSSRGRPGRSKPQARIARTRSDFREPVALERSHRALGDVILDRALRSLAISAFYEAHQMRLDENAALLIAAARSCDFRKDRRERGSRAIILAVGECNAALGEWHSDFLPHLFLSARLRLGVILEARDFLGDGGALSGPR